MQTDRLNWNDLRYFLELSRRGRLLTTAERLGVNHSTVSRRIAALESALGVSLFEQDENGFHLTPAGEQLQPLAQQVEDTADLAKERTQYKGRTLTGNIRIGAPDGFGNAFLAGCIHRFMHENPQTTVELVPVPLTHNLVKREVDMVISLEKTKRPDLHCVKITNYTLLLYVSKKYAKGKNFETSQISDLPQHPFADYIPEILYTDELSFNRHINPDIKGNFQSSTVLAQYEFVANGGGLGVLPYYMAYSDRRLMTIMTEKVSFVRFYWLIIPLELRRLARIRALEKFVMRTAAEHQSVFMPEIH